MKEKEKDKIEYPLDDAERLLSMGEVGERLGTGYAFAGRLVRAGLLGALFFKKVKRVPKSELEKFIKKHIGQDIYEVLERAEQAIQSEGAA
ncbi:MAG: hypothetical protein IJT82_01375 [Schwartzia sp.]|nr:hypothetical protein [Schwartzia sp. (in: firmicutes)]